MLELPCFVKMLRILLYLAKALGNAGHRLHLHTCAGVLLPSLSEDLLHGEAPGVGTAELLPGSSQGPLVWCSTAWTMPSPTISFDKGRKLRELGHYHCAHSIEAEPEEGITWQSQAQNSYLLP